MTEQDLEKATGKKFDIVLMNPPYDNGLHADFLEKILKISNSVITVQPTNWLVGKKQNKRITSLIDNCYVNIENIDATNIFKAHLETEVAICCFKLLDDKHIIFNGNEIYNITNVRVFSKDKYLIEFNNKIKHLYEYNNANNYRRFPEKNEDEDLKKYIIRISLVVRGYKLFANDTKVGLYKDLIKLKTNKASVKGETQYLKMYFAFDNESTMKNAYNYLRTDFVNSCLMLSKTNMNTNRGELKYVPWFDFSDEHFNKSPREIDDWLFKKYNISNDIRKHIEKILPDYYGIRK